MQNDPDGAERWLDNEDSSQREDRLTRLRWMETLMPHVDTMIFGGGLISKHLFEESRYCFVYGQFLAAIVMGLSFIEISLGGAFYGIGRNDLERAGIAELAKEALKMGWITKEDFEAIERAREYRNPVTHFRRPGHDRRIETRALTHDFLPYEIIENDARHVIQTVFHLLLKIVPLTTNRE